MVNCLRQKHTSCMKFFNLDLLNELSQVRSLIKNKKSDISESNFTEILISSVSIFQAQNFFMKSVLEQKHIITDKFLGNNKNQIKMITLETKPTKQTTGQLKQILLITKKTSVLSLIGLCFLKIVFLGECQFDPPLLLYISLHI